LFAVKVLVMLEHTDGGILGYYRSKSGKYNCRSKKLSRNQSDELLAQGIQKYTIQDVTDRNVQAYLRRMFDVSL